MKRKLEVVARPIARYFTLSSTRADTGSASAIAATRKAHAHAAPEKARKCRAPGARRCRQAYPTVAPSRTSTTTIRSR
jgi:hypothetical protein